MIHDPYQDPDMTRIAPPSPELLEQCEVQLTQAETHMGYQPNDVLSLCH